MGESTFTFRVDEDLKAAFTETAKAQDRTAAQLLRFLMRETVERRNNAQKNAQTNALAHDEWFRGQVEQALREADDPSTPRIGHMDADADWRTRRTELSRRAGRKPA